MILKKLEIELNSYGPDKGLYTGAARFTNDDGEVTLRLNKDHCNKIFEICADSILATAKEAASNLTCSVIEHRKSLGIDA